MLKSIKFFAIILIIFSMFISFYSVYASSIDMNLVSNETSDQNTIDNETTDNTNIDDNIGSQVPSESGDEIVPPSSVGATAEDGLGLTNILNILLITVGVILILLSIAIIIRLK